MQWVRKQEETDEEHGEDLDLGVRSSLRRRTVARSAQNLKSSQALLHLHLLHLLH